MKLKHRFSLSFSSLFSAVLAVVLITVYLLFSKFRQEEFRTRLLQRAKTSVKILVAVKGLDVHQLLLLDKNRANRLPDEKTVIYDGSLKEIYSSNKLNYYSWSRADFERMAKTKVLFLNRNNYEIAALLFSNAGREFYVISSAKDDYEYTKMQYLKFLLLIAFFVGTASVFILSFYVSSAGLKRLQLFGDQILEITGKNLQKRVELSGHDDEINLLARTFNEVMDRIDTAYQQQTAFTANASHELRTPLARISAQLENFLQNTRLSAGDREVQMKILHDTHQLSDIVTSLLILSEVENSVSAVSLKTLRLDEVIFAVIADFSRIHHDLKFSFEIENSSDSSTLDIPGDEILLKVAFTNLIKNAYLYSDNKAVKCTIFIHADKIAVSLVNSGPVPQLSEPKMLFNTFVRGTNSQGVSGSGVGLSLANRILEFHKAELSLLTNGIDTTELLVTFRKDNNSNA